MLFLYIIIGVLIVVIAILIYMISKRTSDLKMSENTNTSLNENIGRLLEEIKPLRKYRGCVNAEKEVAFMLSQANSKSDRIISDATLKSERAISEAKAALQEAEDIRNAAITEVEEEKKTLLFETKEKVARMETEANESLSAALSQASKIIEDAEMQAKKIAGSAYNIKKDAEYYRELAKAMRNIVDGYGDKYLKPTYSVLDDLAEEFGFTEAGNALKDSRKVVKRLIVENLAANCDYVERNRKDTAIAFVLDAFNGKVDSILSLIKKDNYGTLERKIQDAYAVVNHLGSAFRNARITPQYLTARLSELKWGVAVVALKQQEREEQRAIKERIREEERAHREYEKAMKDAAKQEELIRKAMDKARAEIEKASAEQKAKYEAQLQELELKLADAEARSQRALSMAQQTKSGHVYVISNIGSFGENVYKIGMTRRLEPLDRVRELGDASVPFPFDVHAMIYSEDAPTLETELHKIFAKYQVNKVNPRKEFFRLPIEQVRDHVNSKGIDAHWTILAEAAQYRETLALEKSFESDVQAQRNWEEKLENEISSEDDEEDA